MRNYRPWSRSQLFGGLMWVLFWLSVAVFCACRSARADILTPLVPVQLAPAFSPPQQGTLQLRDVVTPPVLKLPEKARLFALTTTPTWDWSIMMSIKTLSFQTQKGDIVIDLQDGSVKLPKGLKPDAAAKEFWKAVTAAFPEVRKALQEKKP